MAGGGGGNIPDDADGPEDDMTRGEGHATTRWGRDVKWCRGRMRGTRGRGENEGQGSAGEPMKGQERGLVGRALTSAKRGWRPDESGRHEGAGVIRTSDAVSEGVTEMRRFG